MKNLVAFIRVNCVATALRIACGTFGLHLPTPTPLFFAWKMAL